MKPRIIWMVIGGLVMALGLFLAVQYVPRGGDENAGETTPTAQSTAQTKDGLTPIAFTNVSEAIEEGQLRLRITGQAQADSVIVLRNRGERLRQLKSDSAGDWSVVLAVDEQPMVVEALMFLEEGGVNIRAEETIFRIPVPNSPDIAAAEFIAPGLVMVSAPGAPTRVIQSPFGASPNNGALSMGAIDYDDAGGVIFSGASAEAGRIRLYAGGQVIGETRVGPDGRWNFIAGKMLPLGEYVIRIELIRADNERTQLSVPFERLPPETRPQGTEGALSVKFGPYRWQVRRSLIGGGAQSTVIFSPSVILERASEDDETPSE